MDHPSKHPKTIQLTNCDWLSFSLHMILTEEEKTQGIRLSCPDGYTLIEYPGTNLYKRRAIMYSNDGEKIVTLLWEPHSRIIDSHSLYCEVANPLLYDGRYRDILNILQAVHSHTWQSLSRLDIATDFEPTTLQMQVIDMLQSGSAYVQGKQDGTMWHHYNCSAKYVTRTPHQLSWGGKASQIKWKLYNKTKEIMTTDDHGHQWCEKPHIAAMWRANGLTGKQDVWRLEVSIMSSSQLQWQGQRLGWWTVDDQQSMESLYYDLVATRMKMRLNQGHDNKRYDKEVPFLVMPDDPAHRLQRVDPSDQQTRILHAATMRNLLKELERPEVQVMPSLRETLLSATDKVIRQAHLDGYFIRAVGKPWADWVQDYIESLPS